MELGSQIVGQVLVNSFVVHVLDRYFEDLRRDFKLDLAGGALHEAGVECVL